MKTLIKTNILENYIKENKLTKAELCRKCGISLYSLNKVLQKDGSVMFGTFVKLTEFLNCHVEDFVNRDL